MELFLVILLITVGVGFMYIDAFLLPGTAVVGAAGGIMAAIGVYLVYINFGSTPGNIALLLTVVVTAYALITGLRKVANLNWADKKEIDSRMNVVDETVVMKGDSGKTHTELRPNGKAVINGIRMEVFSTGPYIPKGATIEVFKVTSQKILVKETTT